jgi:hypothetical protein
LTTDATDVTPPDVDAILDFLRHERSALSETRAQRLSFRALQGCVAGYVASGLFLLIAHFAFGAPVSATTGPGAPAGGWTIAVGAAFLLFGACIVGSLILLPLNLFLMRRLRESMRLLGRFGIQKALEAPWRIQSLTPTLGNALGTIGFLVGGLWTVIAVFGLVGLVLVSAFSDSMRFMRDFLLWLVAASPGLILIAYYLIQRARLRYALLADVTGLEAMLARQKRESQGGAAIEIDPSTRRKLGVIEQAKIRRERVEAISASLAEGEGTGYSVLRSVRSAGSATDLGFELQIKAEALIQRLSRDPTPPAASAADKQGVRTLQDPEAGVGIRYVVDEASRTIRVLDIVRQT